MENRIQTASIVDGLTEPRDLVVVGRNGASVRELIVSWTGWEDEDQGLAGPLDKSEHAILE